MAAEPATTNLKKQPPKPPSSSQANSNLAFFGKSVHISCDRSLRDLAKNKLECFGNVYIKRTSELLTADYVLIDMNTEDMHAEGNVVYFTSDTVIYGSKMDFNFLTETGVIEDGRIESDKYELLGEKIERLSEDHFIVRDGEYTTCRDCPASWRLAGRNVDLTVNNYVYMKHVFIKVNDASSVYFPYVVVPVKTSRQSGFLFPKMGTTQQDGFTFVQPYFWAISRSMDATLGAGVYTQRGFKSEGEFRYDFGSRTAGTLNGFYLKDKKFLDPYHNRWAYRYSHNIEFPWKIDQKLNLIDAFDRDYSRRYPNDLPNVASEPALVSEAGLSKSERSWSLWVTAKRIRNTLTPGVVGFDPNTVQLLPRVDFASTDHRISDSFQLHWGLTASYARFWRPTPQAFDPQNPIGFDAIDRDTFVPGITPLREAERVNFIPELYYPIKLGDYFQLVPSVQYRSYFYSFDKNVAGTLSRGYLVAQTDLSTTIERVYSDSVKHKFTPSIKYSRIPFVTQDTSHPFIEQIKVLGNQFDDSDIVPITAQSQTYFVPLGNSLSYRLGNKFILKNDSETQDYRKVLDLTAGQSINFIELRDNPGDREPFSRFFTTLMVDTKRLQASGEYFYYPYQRASTYTLTTNYIFARYQRRLLSFLRTVGLSYSYNQVTTHSHSLGANIVWSLNDYWGVQGGLQYQFPMGLQSYVSPGLVVTANVGMMFQSPSQCYRVVVLGTRNLINGWAFSVNVPINLTGEGFLNVSDAGGGGSGGPGLSNSRI